MSAIISECGQYRYRLERDRLPPLPDCIIDDENFHPLTGKVVAFFGINPSTADASLDDATVRKWTGFCRRWGVGRFIVGNVFSYRATDVRQLDIANRNHIKVQGAEHWQHLHAIINEADVLVPCWGDSKKVDRNLRPLIGDLMSVIAHSGKPFLNFGLTSGGDPKHPLMLGYNTQLVPWRSCAPTT